jgi:hypothetical protein
VGVDAERRVVVKDFRPGVDYPLGDPGKWPELGPPCKDAPILPGEGILYAIWNRQFHRTNSFGLVLTTRAVYVYQLFLWFFSWWRRVDLASVQAVEFVDHRSRPALRWIEADRVTRFHMHWETDAEEVDFNRKQMRMVATMARGLLEDIKQ